MNYFRTDEIAQAQVALLAGVPVCITEPAETPSETFSDLADTFRPGCRSFVVEQPRRSVRLPVLKDDHHE